jgi:hypothetical protein
MSIGPPRLRHRSIFVSTSPSHVGTGREGTGSIMAFQCISRLIGSLRMDVRSRMMRAERVES